MIRALAIDGGGVRGIVPATVLAALEDLSGRRVHELFDLVAGTSTGAILALGLTRPSPQAAGDLGGLYAERGGAIFPPAGEPGEPRDPGPLEVELTARLGMAAMSDALRPALVVSCDADARRPVVFRGGGLDPGAVGDAPMVRAALASSAFPGVFPPVRHVGADWVARACVDGGLIANDPGLVAYAEARALGRGEEVLLVSLGTGLGPPPEATDDPDAVALATAAAPELVRESLRRALGDRYARLQTPLAFGAARAFDDASPGNLEALRLTADQLVARERPRLERLARLLTA
ncbi:MAG TPA: patatin-like phospholipase family protein [Miltoncostaeaceae bacterium]|nr:patatin-like phospholipase family protein [Miltoncostaeaceae bacterium]